MTRILLATGGLLAALVVAACGGGGLADEPPSAGLPDDYVDADNGSDANDGSSLHPFQTIAHALGVAQSGESIRVYAGPYDASNGETFPLLVPAGVSVFGDEGSRGTGRLVSGSGAVPSWATWQPSPTTTFAAVVLDQGSVVAGLQIENPTNTPASDVDACASHRPRRGRAAPPAPRRLRGTGCRGTGTRRAGAGRIAPSHGAGRRTCAPPGARPSRAR